MSLPQISQQELRFVEEYCHHKIVVRAALAAKLSDEYQRAFDMGKALLKKKEIQTWIKSTLRRSGKRLKFHPTQIVEAWQRARTANLEFFVLNHDTGQVETAPGIPREYIEAVRKVEYTIREIPQGKDAPPLIERKARIELRDPFGPECKLMEHFKEIAGDAGEQDSRAVIGLPGDDISASDALVAAEDAASITKSKVDELTPD